MPQAGAIRAGRAFVELFADDSKLVRGLKRAQAKLKAFGASIRSIGLSFTALGGAIITPLLAATKIFADMGDNLFDMSKRTGFSIETLSALGLAAELTGANIETLEVAIKQMQKAIIADKSALKDLGLSFEQLKGLSPEEQFRLIADRLSQIEDPTRKAALAMAIFGRSGTAILPLIEGGAAGIDEFIKKAAKLGLIMSAEDAKAAEEFNDEMTIMSKVLKMTVFQIGSALAPVLRMVATWIVRTAKVTGEWIKQNKQVVVTVLAIGASAIAAGTALVAFGTAIKALAAGIGIATSVFGILHAVLVGVVAVMTFLLSPIGLIVAAVAILGTTILVVTGAAGKALAWLGARFGELKIFAAETWRGIADALAAGDIALAAKILWISIKVAWTKGVSFLEQLWLGFRNFFIKLAADSVSGWLLIFETLWTGLRRGFTYFITGVKIAWTVLSGVIINGVATIWNAIAGLLNKLPQIVRDKLGIGTLGEMKKIDIGAKIKEIGGEGRADIEAEDKRHADRMKKIIRDNEQLKDNLDRERDDKAKKRAEEIAELEAERRAALDEARRKREAAEAGKIEAAPEMPKMPELPDIGGLQETLDRATIGVTGTFNAAALLGLQAGGIQDRIANATERTARGIELLRKDMAEDEGLEFA